MSNSVTLGVAYTDQRISGGSIDNTPVGDSGGKVGFYGKTPIVQRASSNQATTNLATSSSFGATQLAVVQEIMNTLTALGLWKGAA